MFKDNRGRGLYNIFTALPKGQINLSVTYPNVVRAFHRHLKQTDYWYVVSGDIEVCLKSDFDSPFFIYMRGGEDQILKIPPTVWHGFRVLGNEPATLLYYVTESYNPDFPDEERAEWNAFTDWKTEFK